jgi:hypothetical protein
VAEELSDWEVVVTLNRKAIVEKITKLAEFLAREKIYYTVAASSRDEAIEKAKVYLQRHVGVPERYVRSLHPRRLPT